MMVERAKLKPLKPADPKRVYDIGAPKVHGTVVDTDFRVGNEVVEVKWDDPSPWGLRGFHIKRFLRKVGEPAITANEKAVFKNAVKFIVMDLSHEVDKCKKFSDAKQIVLANKDKCFSIHAVTKHGNSIVVLRSLWSQYDKLEG
jgi:hypothetical protein